jgi:hypothetical protein
MTTADLAKTIGREAILSSDKLCFTVQIQDAKLAYGNVRYLVSPVSGTGSVWVDSSRVQITES